MADTRRTFSEKYKTMIAEEYRDALKQLGTSYQAGKAVGRKYKIHPSQVERWAKELTEREGAKQPPPQRPTSNMKYAESFKEALIEELRLGLPKEGPSIWARLSQKYGVHNTTLRDWYRKAAGASPYHPDTGKRTRGIIDPDLREAYQPPDDPPPVQQTMPSVAAERAAVHHYQPEDVERPPEVQWRMANGQPMQLEYLAQRVHELEHQVRVLGAEKQALMVALGLVNTHKVDVPGR